MNKAEFVRMINLQAFFKKIESQLDRFNFYPKCKIIIGGDFNIFFDDILDCLGGNPKIKQKSVDIVKDIMLANELTDVWRMRHPGKKRFTWRQPNSTIQRRLDFWLISNSCQEDISSTDIIPAIKTDHSDITLITNQALLTGSLIQVLLTILNTLISLRAHTQCG